MEETVPILHSGLVRCNTYRSKNPYGGKLSYLCVICPWVTLSEIEGRNDSARTGAYRETSAPKVVTYPSQTEDCDENRIQYHHFSQR